MGKAKHRMFRVKVILDGEQANAHSLPVFVQVRENGVPCIRLFCNKHPDCITELQNALRNGRRVK